MAPAGTVNLEYTEVH